MISGWAKTYGSPIWRRKLHPHRILETLLLSKRFSFERLPQALALCSSRSKEELVGYEEGLHGWTTSKSLISQGFYKGRVLTFVFIVFVLIHNKKSKHSQCFRYVDEKFIPFTPSIYDFGFIQKIFPTRLNPYKIG